MSGASQSFSASPRSWRQRKDAALPETSSKKINRVLFSLLTLVLVCLLTWIVWPSSTPPVHLIYLPIVDYDVLTVEPIQFSAEDKLAFCGLAPRDSAVILGETYNSLVNSDIVHRDVGRKEAVILYISAHGVSDKGNAFLLCSDYLRESKSNRLEIDDLLAKLGKCRAGVKLLALDVNHLAADPRLGLMANEFPKLLEEKVRKFNDPNLWVLMSAGPMENSRVSYIAGRSLFSYYFTAGITWNKERSTAAADSNKNGIIELKELVDFIRAGVSDSLKHIGGNRETQTVCLLRGGTGYAEPPPDLALLPVRSGGPENAPEQKKPDAQPAKEKDKNKSGEAQLTESEKKRRKVREDLMAAWDLRDEIQKRGEKEGVSPWTPLDYAPHFWRELEMLLLGYELRYRGGIAFDADKLDGDLTNIITRLKEAVKTGDTPPSGDREDIVHRLAEARKYFMETEKNISSGFESLGEKGDTLKRLVQVKNDLVFRAPYYVKWHTRAMQNAPKTADLYKPISNLLENLPEFIDSVETARKNLSTEKTEGDREGRFFSDLVEKAKKLESLRNEIDAGLNGEADTTLKEIETSLKTGQEGDSRKIEELLGTPLLPARQRLNLLKTLDVLAGAKLPLPLLDAANSDFRPGAPEVPQWKWERLGEQALLEVQLVRLADKKTADALADLCNGLARPESWRQYGELGQALEAFYENLPDKINDGDLTADQADAAVLEGWLRALDARDVRRVADAKKACQIALRPPQIPSRTKLELIVREPNAPIDRIGTDFDLRIKSLGRPVQFAQIRLDFGNQLEIVSLDENQPVQAKIWRSLSLEQGQAAARRFKVRDVRSPEKAENETIVPLEIEVQADGQPFARKMQWRLPPDSIDLKILRVAPEIGKTSDRYIERIQTDRLLLRPFPNKSTIYRCELVNQSQRSRPVRVQLLGLTEAPRGREFSQQELRSLLTRLKKWVPGDEPPKGFQRLAESPAEVVLPADNTPQTIRFANPKAPKTEKEPGKAEPAKNNAAAPSPSVTYGMACVIQDLKEGQRWVRWIGFKPLKPKDYVVPGVSYNPGKSGVITFDLKTKTDSPEDLPPLPIKVNLILRRAENALGLNVPGKYNGEISLEQKANLYAEIVPLVNQTIFAQLTVDNYPRAFTYRITRYNSDEFRDIRRVEVAAPPENKAYKIETDKETRIPVQFQVDAPVDAFQILNDWEDLTSEDQEDFVSLMLIDKGKDEEKAVSETRFYNDRQVEVVLAEITPQGELNVNAKASDFNVEAGTKGLENTRAEIRVQLHLGTRTAASGQIGDGGLRQNPDIDAFVKKDQDRRVVLLDAEPPRFDVLDVPGAVIQGDDVDGTIALSKKELSGVKKIQYGFDLDHSDVLEESEAKTLPLQPGEGGPWKLSLPSKDLKPGNYTLLVRVTDQVDYWAVGKKTVEIQAPPLPQSASVAKTGTIEVEVVRDDGKELTRKPVFYLNGSLTAPSLESGGKFIFKDLSFGKYNIKAVGSARGAEAQGAAHGIELSETNDTAKIKLVLKPWNW